MSKTVRTQYATYKSLYTGFTLVELLVVLAIIGILATLIAGGFRSSQMRGRDAQRKSDLKQLAGALELYFSDYNKYPDSSSGQIAGCPPPTACAWGTKEFTDGKTTYFKVVPADPSSPSLNYWYRIVDSPTNQKFQLFAHLENSQDKNCLEGNCTNPTVPGGVSCGKACNFSVTSPNTKPTE